jgi:hypothetical protein
MKKVRFLGLDVHAETIAAGDYLRCTVWAVSHGAKESHAEKTEAEMHIDAPVILF